VWRWPELDTDLLVVPEVASMLQQHRQGRWWGPELGGQLFVDVDSPHGLRLALATSPSSLDRASRHWLELDADRCRAEVVRANAIGLRLVGYWHTHPQWLPALSPRDILSFERFSSLNALALPHPLAVIVGWAPGITGIRAWSMRREPIEAVHMVGSA
jgi:hypothetical protein